MKRIYLNNGATSYPKPPAVAREVARFIAEGGANFSRGAASENDVESMGIVFDAREAVFDLLGGSDPEYVTFTMNVTQSLNFVLKGSLRPGMRAVTTSMEHNAVARPLRDLEKIGVDVEIVKCGRDGSLDLKDFERALEKKTDLAVMSCASNVCGTIQDISGVAEICRSRGVRAVFDTAQAAGHLPLSLKDLGASALCFTGHKGLLAPQGIGGIVWDEEFAKECSTIVEGGTGSFSHEVDQPESMPDKFESGTPNMPGIVGLLAGISFIKDTGLDAIAAKEDSLAKKLREGLKNIPGAIIYGEGAPLGHVPVVAINIDGVDNARAADALSSRYGIETRPGLHCAPYAHQTIGSFPQGALRLSPGYFTTEEEIDAAISALTEIAKER